MFFISTLKKNQDCKNLVTTLYDSVVPSYTIHNNNTFQTLCQTLRTYYKYLPKKGQKNLLIITAYRSSFHASGTPGRHQWLQSALWPTGILDDGPTLYTDGWPSLLCAVIRVTFSTCILDEASKAGFSIPGHRCSEILDVFSSGDVSVAQPPLFVALPVSFSSMIQ